MITTKRLEKFKSNVIQKMNNYQYWGKLQVLYFIDLMIEESKKEDEENECENGDSWLYFS